ncbi:MAG: hypothetical protein R2854_24040 [Caldilineaceae bacterium]
MTWRSSSRWAHFQQLRLPARQRQYRRQPPGHAQLRAGGASYLFILFVQLLAIFWTQSHGPWLGLFLGGYVFVLLTINAPCAATVPCWAAGSAQIVLGIVVIV